MKAHVFSSPRSHAGRIAGSSLPGLAVLTGLLASGLGFPGRLTAQAPPVITRDPTNASASVGATVTFRVYHTGASPIGYQWHFTNRKGTVEGPLDGAVNPSALRLALNLTNVQPADAGSYHVVLTNAWGSATSHVATLSVDSTFTTITEGPVATNSAPYGVVVWWDYDNDNALDLFLSSTLGSTVGAFYHNAGEGRFTRVTTNAIALRSDNSFDAAAGDFDNDGDPDLFVARPGASNDDLFRNDGGGQFLALTYPQVGPPVADGGDSYCAGWADYDNDGFLDLFVVNASKQADQLYRNTRNGSFVRMTTNEVGVLVGERAESSAFAWGDFDNDRYPDLYVPYDGVAPVLYHNDRQGGFAPLVIDPAVITDSGSPAWGDMDNDGYLDLFVAQGTNGCSLYRNLQGQGFTNITDRAGMDLGLNAFVGAWGDYDNDGALDLYLQSYHSTNALLHNNGDGTFTSLDVGSPLTDGNRDVCAAWGDYDNDGFLDLVIACGNGQTERSLLYRNNTNQNAWLKVKLLGTAANRSGIGAKVRVQTTVDGVPVWQLREISGNSAYGGGGGTPAHFGLGSATRVDVLRIEWPSGNVQELVDVAPNHLEVVTEPQLITPPRPSACLNASITLTRAVLSGASYQWRFEGVDLIGQTNRALTLTQLTAEQAGTYSVVASNATAVITNAVYLQVDATFTRITEGPIVNDSLNTWYAYWGDYDNDDRLDVLVAGSVGHWRLYHNDGGTQFSTVTHGVMGEFAQHKLWGVWTDPDNDGDLDLLADITGSAMFWNEGLGHFACVREAGGAWVGSPLPAGGVCGGAWGDFDGDGYLDAFSSSSDTYTNALLRNNGNATFTWVSNSVLTLACDRIQVTGVVDYDQDGDLDIVPVRYEGRPTRFYRNDGRGHFEEATPEPIRSQLTYSLSSAWGDFDNDGDLDVFFGGWNNLRERFYVNQGHGTFAAWNGQPALFEPTGTALGGWAGWGDYDNDGYLDLAITKWDSAIRLWRNLGNGRFLQVLTASLANESGGSIQSGSWVDFNQDGNLDLFLVTVNGGKDRLLMGNGQGNHWLEVRLKGVASNRLGVGARIYATATLRGRGTVRQLRVITASDSEQSLVAHFGLGDAGRVSKLRIEWPSGAAEELTDLAADQLLTLTEPALGGAFGEDGRFHVTVTGNTNQTYGLQVSDDLVHWATLTNCAGPGPDGVLEVCDPTAVGTQRYYRLGRP